MITATEPKRFEIDPAKPFDRGCNSFERRYKCQNMLVRQVRFPEFYYEGDFIDFFWSDRDYARWQAACKLLPEDEPGPFECFMHRCPQKLFLAFCKVACGMEPDAELTGARILRFTDSGEFSRFLVNAYRHNPDNPKVPVYTGEDAPNVIHARRRLGFDCLHRPMLIDWGYDGEDEDA